MAQEENLMILRMLQDGHISAEQAAELLHAIGSGSGDRRSAQQPTAPVLPVPPTPPFPPTAVEHDAANGETVARARAKIAEARERVAGVQEKLNAADEKLGNADKSANPWEQVADALKDVPGARSISEALRGVDPGRIASVARRQARRVGRTIRSSVDDMNIDFDFKWTENMQGEPTLAAPRETIVPMQNGGALRIKNVLGDIEAVGADIPEARIAGTLRIWASDLAMAEHLASEISLKTEIDGNNATVSVEQNGKAKRIALDLKAFVPLGVRLSLISPSGDLSAEKIGSDTVLATQSGDIHAKQIAGNVAAESASGDITVEHAQSVQAIATSGDIEILHVVGDRLKAATQSGDVTVRHARVKHLMVETMSGDAAIQSLTADTVHARSVSGDMEITDAQFSEKAELDTVSGFLQLALSGNLTSGTFQLSAVSGDIDLKLPHHTAAHLDCSTTSGQIDGTVYRHMSKSDDNSMTTAHDTNRFTAQGMKHIQETAGDVANGAANFTLSTVSGDISIKQADSEDVKPDNGDTDTKPVDTPSSWVEI